MANHETRLKPKIGRIAMLAMAVGIIVGPWMPQMPFWFSLSGPSIALVFIIVMLLAIPIILAYSELTAMLPFAGGGYNFARNALGETPAWITGWFMILLYLIATAFMAPATARMFQALFMLNDVPETVIGLAGIGILLVFSAINTFSINASARLQLIMVMGMVAVGVATFLWFFGSGNWSPENLTPFFATGATGFVVAVGIMITMVIGFDCIPQLAEEANYPRRDMLWIMLAAVLISESMFALICLANAGMKDSTWITQQIVVSPEIARELAGDLPAALMNIAGLLATLTCLNGFMISAARVMFAMGRTRVLPPILSNTNRYNVPHIGVWVVFALSSLLVLIGGEHWLETLIIAAAFSTGIVYTLVSASAVVLRRKQPNWPRPIKMPGGVAMGMLAALIAIGLSIAAGIGMPSRSWILFAIWVILGMAVYSWMAYRRQTNAEYQHSPIFTPTDIVKADGR